MLDFILINMYVRNVIRIKNNMKSIHLDRNPKLNVLYDLPFGSDIYNVSHNYSDLDLIRIVKESTGDFVFRFNEWCDIQNRELDITYIGINEFISGLEKYSNIEFFEALHTTQGREFMENHNLNLSMFYNSHQAKAFLGMAARDLKYPERLKHVLRCIYIAQRIVNKLLFVPKETPTTINDLQKALELDTLDGLDELIRTMRGQLVYV